MQSENDEAKIYYTRDKHNLRRNNISFSRCVETLSISMQMFKNKFSWLWWTPRSSKRLARYPLSRAQPAMLKQVKSALNQKIHYTLRYTILLWNSAMQLFKIVLEETRTTSRFKWKGRWSESANRQGTLGLLSLSWRNPLIIQRNISCWLEG